MDVADRTGGGAGEIIRQSPAANIRRIHVNASAGIRRLQVFHPVGFRAAGRRDVGRGCQHEGQIHRLRAPRGARRCGRHIPARAACRQRARPGRVHAGIILHTERGFPAILRRVDNFRPKDALRVRGEPVDHRRGGRAALVKGNLRVKTIIPNLRIRADDTRRIRADKLFLARFQLGFRELSLRKRIGPEQVAGMARRHHPGGRIGHRRHVAVDPQPEIGDRAVYVAQPGPPDVYVRDRSAVRANKIIGQHISEAVGYVKARQVW